MVDIDTSRIVDMIQSRELEDVSKWLAGFPNIQVVSRDGSQTYCSAITKAHPNACQVSDRFHILKNLTEAVIQHFQKIFQGRISIPITSKTAELRTSLLLSQTKREKILIVKKLKSEGRSNSEIKCITDMTEKTIKKYIDMAEDKIPIEKKVVREREHEDAINKVQGRSDIVRSLKEQGLSIYKISKETGFTRATIKRYLSPDFNPANGHYGCHKHGVLAPFRDEVLHMRSEGMKYKEIHEFIVSKGYTGTEDAIRGFITKEKRISKDLSSKSTAVSVPTELIERKWLIKLLFKPLCEVKGITEEQFSAVINKYPKIEKIYEAVKEFKEIMFSKRVDDLSDWMKNTSELEIEEINSFINGLNMDIVAVKNAILLGYNNGLAEGSVNKLKVTKRIMYGRNKFDLLRKKVLLLENR